MKSEEEMAGKNLSRAFLQFPYLYRYGKKMHPMHGASGCNLRPSDVVMLFAIKSEQNKRTGVTATLLSASTGMKTPSINAVLSALEKRGLIRRVTDTGDRRFVLITLSESGERAVDHFRRVYESHVRELVVYLGAEKSNLLAELMNEVYEYLRQKCGRAPEKTQKQAGVHPDIR